MNLESFFLSLPAPVTHTLIRADRNLQDLKGKQEGKNVAKITKKAPLFLQRIKDSDIPDHACASFAERLHYSSRQVSDQQGALTVSSCLMHSMVASSALVPRVASSSTAFTVFRRDVTFVTITCQMKKMRAFTPEGGVLSP